MKYILFSLLFFSIACQSGDGQITNEKKENISSENLKTDDRPFAKVIVDNPADYSEAFVKAFKEQKQFSPVHLADDSMIINKTKAIPFPNVPTLGEEFIFKGDNKKYAIDLHIKRINYSTISYEVAIKEASKKQCNRKGTADLSPYFFLGTETDTNEKTGEEYFSLEYSDSQKDCYTNIRIGIGYEKSDEGVYFVKVISNCIEDCSTIELEDTPILNKQ